MKRIISLLLILVVACTIAGARQYKPQEVPNLQLRDSTLLLIDPENILLPATQTNVNLMLRDIRRQTGVEAVFVAVPDIDNSTDVETFATELFELWGLGKKGADTGLLLLFVPGQRSFTFRTGYGIEGVLPDGALALIYDREAVPHLKKGDYDSAVTSTVQQLHNVLTDPAAKEEMIAALKKAQGQDESFFDQMLDFLMWWCGIIFAVSMIVLFYGMAKASRQGTGQIKYLATQTVSTELLLMSVMGLGVPVPLYLILKYKRNSWRNGVHVCPNCGNRMRKLDEVSDNLYLTPAQDAEERLNSVDYDVWLCPDCGATDIYAYNNPESKMKVCPKCNARTLQLVSNSVKIPPTQHSEGVGVRTYRCHNCNNVHNEPYRINRKPPSGPIIIPGGFTGGGGFSGGSSGGSFGGGSTGGGGFTGNW